MLRLMPTVKNSEIRKARQSARVEALRDAITSAADRLFRERGYVVTTLEVAVAAEAGVAIQTIYNSVGPKSALLSSVLDRAAAGPEAVKRVPEFMRERVAATSDVEGMVQVFADWFVEVMPRVAPIQAIFEEAGAVDKEIQKLGEARVAQRYRNYIEAGRELKARGGGGDASAEELAASIWTIGHPNVFRFFVLEQGWPSARYRSWLERNLRAAFSASPQAGGSI